MPDCIEMCWHCGACFLSQSKLQEHYRDEHSLEVHICNLCGKVFTKPYAFLQHMSAHSRNMHSCCVCGKTCRKDIDLYTHLITAHVTPDRIDCDTCAEKKLCWKLKRHILRSHASKIASLASVGESYCTVHSPRTFFGYALPYGFDNPLGVSSERSERDAVRAIGNFEDGADSRELQPGRGTRAHLKQQVERPRRRRAKGRTVVHPGSETTVVLQERAKVKLECPYCEECFRSRETLHRHRKDQHPEEAVACRLCAKKIFDKNSMRGHTTAHLRKLHACSFCGRNCPQLLDLHIHVTTFHESEGRIVCVLCGRTYTRKTNLKDHLFRIHVADYLSIVNRAELYCSIHCDESFPEDVMLCDSEQRRVFKDSRKAAEDESEGGQCCDQLVKLPDEVFHQFTPDDPNFHWPSPNVPKLPEDVMLCDSEQRRVFKGSRKAAENGAESGECCDQLAQLADEVLCQFTPDDPDFHWPSPKLPQTLASEG